MANGTVAAPFVVKTYRMVDDASTDAIITWGRDDNSFVVVDPFTFAQTLLPAHFKHGNFSSFVRQLNTYGFRKVDADRWEFAHESFLRGQTHLLRHIVRRNGAGAGRRKGEGQMEGGEEEAEGEKVATEVVRLKQEQRRIEERVQGMWRRVQEIEQRPRQMLAFLVKVAGDPTLLDHMGAPAVGATEGIEGGEKRAPLGAAGDRHWDINYASDDVEEAKHMGDNRLLGTIEPPFGGMCCGGAGWVGNELGGLVNGYQFPYHVESRFY